MEWAASTPMCGGYKFRRDISGARSPSPTPGPPAQGSSNRKISPHNFCKNQWGLSPQKKLLESQAVPLKQPTHGFRLTPSEFQYCGSIMKGPVA